MNAKGEMTSCTISAEKGRIHFFDMKNSFLVIVADSNTKVDGSVVAIQTAIDKIKNRRVA